MKKKWLIGKFIIAALLVNLIVISCSTPSKVAEDSTIVVIETSMGNIKLALYNETPIHRDNFIKLINNNMYDGTIFHRVINEFMIQGGDPNMRENIEENAEEYTLTAEILPELFHKKGALAAARMGDNVNPNRESSGYQFYIVQGKVFTEIELETLAKRKNTNFHNRLINNLIMEESDRLMEEGKEIVMNEIMESLKDTMDYITSNKNPYQYTPEMVEIYTSIGGTPHLDGDYTVFGEVIDGLDVVDKIAAVETGPGDVPVKAMKMKVRIIKK